MEGGKRGGRYKHGGTRLSAHSWRCEHGGRGKGVHGWKVSTEGGVNTDVGVIT